MRKLDIYIIRKFLGTFFLSIVLILTIAIVFDLTEKLETFYESQIPKNEILFDYYLSFIPYYMNMFSPLFIFIAVIFFTSKLAGNSEIIAILASGISFRRIVMPYMITATLLCGMSFYLGGYIIPPATNKMMNFQEKYIKKTRIENTRNVQMKVSPGTVLYIESFQLRTNSGYRVSLEHFNGKVLNSRLTADRIAYIEDNKWRFENYTHRKFDGLHESVEVGARLDTVIPIVPAELFITSEDAQKMTNTELRNHIKKQKERGTGNLQAFEIEWWKRYASPVSAFIMTLLGLTLASKKVKGGMGKHLGVGVILSALYILFSTLSTSFTVSGYMSPFWAVWLPNFTFLLIGMVLYVRVPK